MLLLPHGASITSLFEGRLTSARQLYDFTDKSAPLILSLSDQFLPNVNPPPSGRGPEARGEESKQRANPPALSEASSTEPDIKIDSKPLNKTEATKLWDRLQSFGCCGLRNATLEWTNEKPKSCCAQPIEDSKNQTVCKAIDQAHNKPCIKIIESLSMNVLFIVALIALANLYLATVSGVGTYRTFHYNEASQNAYS